MATVDVTRIASNIGALNSLNSLQNINKSLATHQTRLSTGKRINSAADDPAGLTIATKMLARSEGMKVALDNISDAKNMMSVAEAGLSKVNDILVQMRSKAEQAASDTLGSSERAAIQTQLSAYSQQIQDLVDQTKWNGVKLLDTATGTKVFQTGVDEGEHTDWTLSSQMDPTNLKLSRNQVGAAATVNSSDTGFVNVGAGNKVVQSGVLGSLTELTTGDYSIKVTAKATDATHGAATLANGLLTGVSQITTAATSASALEASGTYRVTVQSIDNTADTVSYKIENLTDTSWNTNGSLTVSGQSVADAATSMAITDKADGTGATLGMSFSFVGTRSGLVAGQSMQFEYIKQGQVKLQLNDASGVALETARNATASKTGTYAYVTADNATPYATGRGISIELNDIASVAVGHTATFTYARDDRYLVDVSSASKAATYMTTVNSAMDKVNSAMSDLGSLMARLTFKEDAVATAQVNVESSYSRIMNANMAEEQVNASKFAILQQTATAMLAQANQAPQTLLSLFR